MNKVSAISVAGVLLLVAGGPVKAQVYPADPGYDQGFDYGPAEGPAEDLPPGAAYGGDPAYGGPDQAYPEDDYGDLGPDRGPAPSDDNLSLRPGQRHYRYGQDFARNGVESRRGDHRRADEDFGRRGDQLRHRQPSDDDMADQ